MRGDFERGCEGIWNFNTDSVVECHAGNSVYAAFCPTGKLLAFGEDDWNTPSICIWDIATRRTIKRLTPYVSGIDFNRDGSLMAGHNREGYVYIWDTKTWKLIRTLKLDGYQYLNATFTPDNRCIAVGGAEGVRSVMISKQVNLSERYTMRERCLWKAKTGMAIIMIIMVISLL